MDESLAHFCYRLLVSYQEQIRYVCRKLGIPFRDYKALSYYDLIHRLMGIDETEPLVMICARLFYYITRSQALTNANHRSATLLIQSFLRRSGISFPEYDIEASDVNRDFWIHTCNSIFKESKEFLGIMIHVEEEYIRMIEEWMLEECPSHKGELETIHDRPLTRYLEWLRSVSHLGDDWDVPV